MKCVDCSKTIEETFLKKIVGTHMRRDGKKITLCNECQSRATR